MTITDRAIIISCAGMGTRLNMGMPKALIDINGKPLLMHTLEMLDDVEDIRIVVGYQAEKVINLAKSYRDDITFVHNDDYASTGTGASVLLAANHQLTPPRKYILTVDGDIIVHPEDMQRILRVNHEFVGVCKPSTDFPVLTEVKDGKVVDFSREYGQYEWTGVTLLETSHLNQTSGHTYQIIEPSLPIPFELIRQREIDTPDDYKNAIEWVKNNFEEN